jgi:hypothetical protein
MKRFKYMTLHAAKSVMKEEAKGILYRRHKNSEFRSLLIAALVLVSLAMSSFFIACRWNVSFTTASQHYCWIGVYYKK